MREAHTWGLGDRPQAASDPQGGSKPSRWRGPHLEPRATWCQARPRSSASSAALVARALGLQEAWTSHPERSRRKLICPRRAAWPGADLSGQGFELHHGGGRGMGHTTLGTLQISSSGSRPKASSAEKPGQEVQPQSRVKATPWQLAPNRWHPQRHPPPVPPPTWSQVSLPPPSPAQAPLPAPSSFVLHRSKPQTGQPALRPQAGPAGLPVPRASTPPRPWGGPRGLGQGWQVRGTRATERPRPTLAMPGTCWMTEPTGRGRTAAHPQTDGEL